MPDQRETPVVRWADRMAGRDAALDRIRRIRKAMGTPYVRTHTRDPDETRLLRSLGTPERLIGPVRAAD